MASQRKIFSRWLAVLSRDQRITVWHIAVMMALLKCQGEQQCARIQISRRRIMQLVRIRSFMTYHKVIGQLQQFGYIQYFPSYHPTDGSSVVIKKV